VTEACVRGRWIAAIVLLALGLRVATLWFILPTEPVFDETDYLGRALKLARGAEVEQKTSRPPLSIWYYAAFLRAFGERHEVARTANVLVGALLPWVLWIAGRRFAGDRAALIAALAAAVYPEFILFSCGLWAEPLYGAMSVAALGLILGVDADRRTLRLQLAGLLIGLAALTRELGVFLAGAVGVWLVTRNGVRERRGRVDAGILGAAFVLAFLPLSILDTGGGSTLLAEKSWFNLYIGNVAPAWTVSPAGTSRPILTPDYGSYRALSSDPARRPEAARSMTLRRIAERMPWWPLEKTLEMLPRMLQPNSLPTTRMLATPTGGGWAAVHAYVTRVDGTPGEWVRPCIAYANVAIWVVLLLGGTMGLALAWRRPGAGLLLLFVAVHLIPPIVAFAQARYRVPVVPVLAIGLGVLGAHGRASWREAGVVHRVLTVLVVALVAWMSGSLWRTLATPQWV
jgi:4-amino-4-deoxy-L-arabinose transferase-like glycosyltransferase